MSIKVKNDIKNRMIQKAAELWKVSPSDIDSTFDPLVRMLIGATASELAKIDSDIHNSHGYIIEKLVQLMTPEASYGAQPAHGVVSALPVEQQIQLSPKVGFFYKKKFKSPDLYTSYKEVYFSAVRPTKLINAHLHTAASQNTLKSYELASKAVQTYPESSLSNLPNTTLYLGIQLLGEVPIDLKNCSFFFEMENPTYKELFYSQLKLAKFYYHDTPISVCKGYPHEETHNTSGVQLNKLFTEQSQKLISIERQALLAYQNHYISVLSDLNISNDNDDLQALNKKNIPEDILSLDPVYESMHWVKVVFPSTISSEILSEVYASLNTFPVLNRRLEKAIYPLKSYSNIASFATTDLLLDIADISNNFGNQYQCTDKQTDLKKGTYFINDQKVSGLDARSAKEYLQHLIGLLKNESAAFSQLGGEAIQENILRLNQQISILENKVASKGLELKERHYLSLKPFYENENLFIEFWSTVGEIANTIVSGTSLEVYKDADINTRSCFLVLPTTQGKDSLSVDERIHKYRRTLLSRDRIVTREDIKLLCMEVCGNKIKEVIVKKTFRNHYDIHKGLVPTLVITLIANPELPQNSDWEIIKNNILSILEEKSTNIFPYHIQVQ